MTRYRVVAPMLGAASFPKTLRYASVGSFYYGDIVMGCDQEDIDRLIKDGFLEVVVDEEPAAA